VLETVKTIEYHYATPVREVTTQLRLFPRPRRGLQRLLSRDCEVWPRPDRTRRFTDEFGNEVWEFLHQSVAERLRFALGFTTEHAVKCRLGRLLVARLVASHGVPRAGVTTFLSSTWLVDDSEEIRAAARALAGRVRDALGPGRGGGAVYEGGFSPGGARIWRADPSVSG